MTRAKPLVLIVGINNSQIKKPVNSIAIHELTATNNIYKYAIKTLSRRV